MKSILKKSSVLERMSTRSLIYVGALWLLACQAPVTNSLTVSADSVVSVILDTDIGPDYDDVGAMAVLHALANRGEAKILATLSSNRDTLTVPCIDVLNTYFWRPDLPIGAPADTGVVMAGRQRWADTLVAHYPHDSPNTAEAPDAVTVYRRVLANQPDNSVTIITVGFLTNLHRLLTSPPDAHSPLDGTALVKQKVKQWVAMAGKFPEGKEFNIRKDSLAAQVVIEAWPTPVLFSGFEIGKEVLTGLRLVANGSPQSPVRHAYVISIPQSTQDQRGRMSWDQTAVLVAVRGASPYYDTERGTLTVRPDGSNEWQADPNGPHQRLLARVPPQKVARIIETLMMHTP
ncbi:nucleoside hydrolase [Tunicatimonas pelagia]|uniref:nucleoside hydrolase n=1 Tax=Tunicatimonas pelagia TaxID=931531 RepID=UPI0026651B5D|nr:nucleoside hydrolase [Tunicatimonas pelagia]WKN44873.1 nucleoside hydrolase [Tunicatimonas pelagia]